MNHPARRAAAESAGSRWWWHGLRRDLPCPLDLESLLLAHPREVPAMLTYLDQMTAARERSRSR